MSGQGNINETVKSSDAKSEELFLDRLVEILLLQVEHEASEDNGADKSVSRGYSAGPLEK